MARGARLNGGTARALAVALGLTVASGVCGCLAAPGHAAGAADAGSGLAAGPNGGAAAGSAARAGTAVSPSEAVGAEDAALREARARMVREQLAARDIDDPRVLDAMARVPREAFVPPDVRGHAYEDRALPIGYGQTISQPYVVALMTQLARVRPGDRVLEVGTGSGYQAAVLAALGAEVWTLEIVAPLAERAAATLRALGVDRVHVRQGDGYLGWPEAAPFDAILVTAAAPRVPAPLVEQLAVGGRLVMPVGGEDLQELRVYVRTPEGLRVERSIPVRFVPLTGARAERDRNGPPRAPAPPGAD